MLQFDQAWVIPDSTDTGFFYSSFSRGASVILYSQEEIPSIGQTFETFEQSLLETEEITYSHSKDLVAHLTEEIPSDGVSYAIVFLHESFVYIYTQGDSSATLFRSGSAHVLAQGSQQISGTLRPGDTLTMLIGDARESAELKDLFMDEFDKIHNVKQAANAVYENESLEQFSHSALLSLVVLAVEAPQSVAPISQDQGMLPDGDSSPAPLTTGRKRLFILLAVLLICLVGWSAVFGSQRRVQKDFDAKVSAAKEIIQKKVADAEDVGSVDPSEGLNNLKDIDGIVAGLQTEAASAHIKDTSGLLALQKYVEEARRGISKEEETRPSEFYDLALITKDIEGSAVALKGDSLIITDAQHKKAYNVSMEEKAVKELSLKGLPSVKKVVGTEDIVFALASDGVWKIGDKNEKVIPNDGWGTIQDIALFNGNIYLLDSSKQMIWKYLVAEGGFSSAQPYLKEEYPRLESGRAMDIDGAIYVAADTALKFIQGHAETLKIESPTAVTFDDIAASSKQDTLVVLDRNKSKLFLFSKAGGYKKQILASEIGSTKDLVMTDAGSILILSKNKLFKFE